MQRSGQEGVWGMMTKDMQFLSGVLEVLHNCILGFLALCLSLSRKMGVSILPKLALNSSIQMIFFPQSLEQLVVQMCMTISSELHTSNEGWGLGTAQCGLLAKCSQALGSMNVLYQKRRKTKKIQNLKWGNCIVLKLYSNENVTWSAMCLSIAFCLAVSKIYFSFH